MTVRPGKRGTSTLGRRLGSRRWIAAAGAGVVVLAAVGLAMTARRSSEALPDYSSGGDVRRISGASLKLKDGREVEFAGIRLPYDHEPYAEQARATLTKWVADEGVRLRFDERRQDEKGRYLAYVYANDTFINERLVRDGLAFVKLAAGNGQFAGALSAAQAQAQAEDRGIWRTIRPVQTGRFIGDPVRATFHRPECSRRPAAERETIELTGTAEAFARGMSPCGRCNPWQPTEAEGGP